MKRTRRTLPTTVLFVSLVIFVISQLVINSILSPLGIELERLNTEKEALIEENRQMENEIATSSSIKVIKTLTAERLDISDNNKKNIVYVSDTDVIAER
jgi:hypothetical protein